MGYKYSLPVWARSASCWAFQQLDDALVSPEDFGWSGVGSIEAETPDGMPVLITPMWGEGGIGLCAIFNVQWPQYNAFIERLRHDPNARGHWRRVCQAYVAIAYRADVNRLTWADWGSIPEAEAVWLQNAFKYRHDPARWDQLIGRGRHYTEIRARYVERTQTSDSVAQ